MLFGGRILRKKIAARIGLIALVIAVIAALMWAWPAEPLRVGMTREEVDAALGTKSYTLWDLNLPHAGLDPGVELRYDIGLDWRGNTVQVYVMFDNEDLNRGEVPHVVSWRQYAWEASWWHQFRYITKMPHINGVPDQ
jgi:hypothetical protein